MSIAFRLRTQLAQMEEIHTKREHGKKKAKQMEIVLGGQSHREKSRKKTKGGLGRREKVNARSFLFCFFFFFCLPWETHSTTATATLPQRRTEQLSPPVRIYFPITVFEALLPTIPIDRNRWPNVWNLVDRIRKRTPSNKQSNHNICHVPTVVDPRMESTFQRQPEVV